MKLELKPIPQPAPPMEYHLILNEDEMMYIKWLARSHSCTPTAERLFKSIPIANYYSSDPEKCFK